MKMDGRYFLNEPYPQAKEPLVNSWLHALKDARRRTRHALAGIFPEDSIVAMLRDQHKLLIGAPMGEKVYQQLVKCDPQHPRTMMVQGRSMVTGLPAQVEVSSLEVQAADNDQATIPYLDWSREEGGRTIGELLYTIAAHESNWLFVGVLQQYLPAETQALFPRTEDEIRAFTKGKTLSQHWNRLVIVRNHLLDTYREMTLEDFQRQRISQNSMCSAEWVLHECCQFEAECRAEIKTLFAGAKKALDSETG
jgi:hypothetical protein